ncbi:GDSL-like lipase/acylhydrolase family protein [Roseivirga ehrenbergii]|uniref:SGNH hydrolase-type esterase domain-containing protein n=1 Tax=Roseivirga ehrenbergii (strain DSM 102268 / JCM 13514 / KCTC 12282 / NCIMB 14502 / KMM 6017) TaxID=279360 RepID=A0A150XQQ3_ROSEK|nr:GDSL-type esterase/lipase family protein [Roseivirga ehrenbergii]KYG81024.1 hypothetical protein MB14_14680 [Roseivirga ehrenbergii]TCL00888.1 GDSL-like lipase/acylhydrolase family protein [Roseivirga ehrenbergii]
MKLTKREKKVLGWLAYGLFLLTICEIALRVYLVQFADPSRFLQYASRSMLKSRLSEPMNVPHFYLGYHNNPEYENETDFHNSHGFRGKEISLKKSEDIFRIVCIGGSTTYGSGVDDYRQSYPYLLQQKLNSLGAQVEVINAGVQGYNTLQSYLNYILKIEDLEADMLIVYHAFNDVFTRMVWPATAYKAGQSGQITISHPGNDGILRKLSIFRVPLVFSGAISPIGSWNEIEVEVDTYHGTEFVRQLINEKYPSGIFESVPIDSILQTNRPFFFKRNLNKLIREAKGNGTQVVLASVIYSDQEPEFMHVLKSSAYQKAISEHNAITRDLAIEHDLILLDFEKDIPAQNEWFTDGMHFNFLGNQKRAEKISELLLPLIDK